MSAEDIPRALRPFEQVNQQMMTRKYSGTGLGLPLARFAAELHGGSIGIDSTVGEGTTITVSFPDNRVLAGKARPREAMQVQPAQ